MELDESTILLKKDLGMATGKGELKNLNRESARRIMDFLLSEKNYARAIDKETWTPEQITLSSQNKDARSSATSTPFIAEEILVMLPRQIHINCEESGSTCENFFLDFGIEEKGGYYARYYQKRGRRQINTQGDGLNVALCNLLLMYCRYVSDGPQTLHVTYKL